MYRITPREDGGFTAEALPPGYIVDLGSPGGSPGEVIVDELPAPGAVWDAQAGTVREPTQAELLEAMKASKVAELGGDAIDSLAPLFTEGKGRDETALLLASHVLKLCEALKVPADPRLAEVVATGEKALAKKAEVEGATTPEEVEGVEWTP